MTRWLVALAVALGVCAGSSGQSWSCGPSGCRPAAAPPEASVDAGPVARVKHCVGGSCSGGTATLVAHDERSSYFVTCAHVFDDGRGTTEVASAAIGRLGAAVVAVDRPNDLALLKTARCAAKAATVNAVDSVRGVLSAGGFGPSGVLRFVRGDVVGYATPEGATSPSLRMRGAVRPGDSGGPVFDADRRLVAVVWGQRAGETYAVFGAPLRRILASLTRCRPRRAPIAGGRLVPVDRAPRDDGFAEWRSATEKRLDGVDARLRELAERIGDPSEGAAQAVRLDAKINAIAVRLEGFDPAPLEARIGAIEQRLAERPAAAPPRRHYTLVADQSADYWPLLAEEYRRARESYQGVRLASPPTDRVGPLPAMVAWEDKTPVGDVGGYRAVSEALRILSQGRGPELN